MENLIELVYGSLILSIPFLLIVRWVIAEVIRTVSRTRRIALAYRESVALAERTSDTERSLQSLSATGSLGP